MTRLRPNQHFQNSRGRPQNVSTPAIFFVNYYSFHNDPCQRCKNDDDLNVPRTRGRRRVERCEVQSPLVDAAPQTPPAPPLGQTEWCSDAEEEDAPCGPAAAAQMLLSGESAAAVAALRSVGADDDNWLTSDAESGMKSTERVVPPTTCESRDRCAAAASSHNEYVTTAWRAAAWM